MPIKHQVVKIRPIPPAEMIQLLHQRTLKMLRLGKVYEAIAASKAMQKLMGHR
jgi:hypothetical protein